MEYAVFQSAELLLELHRFPSLFALLYFTCSDNCSLVIVVSALI